MDKNKRKSTKLLSKSADKKPKPKPEVKVNQKEKDFQRLEEYLTESGLSLAFNPKKTKYIHIFIKRNYHKIYSYS